MLSKHCVVVFLHLIIEFLQGRDWKTTMDYLPSDCLSVLADLEGAIDGLILIVLGIKRNENQGM